MKYYYCVMDSTKLNVSYFNNKKMLYVIDSFCFKNVNVM